MLEPMGKHSRRPPGDEEPIAPAPAPAPDPLPRGLRRDDAGRVVLDDITDDHPDAPEVAGDPTDSQAPGDTEPSDATASPVEDRRSSEPQESQRRHPARRALDAARRGRRRGARPLEEVGGPIQPTPTVYFGRPPGTENRRAGAAALVGSGLMLVAAFVPWATRSPETLGATTLGWRDASGGWGPGVWMLLLALVGFGLAIGALTGSNAQALQIGDAALGLVVVTIAVLELLRIRDAAGQVAELSDDRASLSPSWGIACALVGGGLLVAASFLHRSTPPAWRQV